MTEQCAERPVDYCGEAEQSRLLANLCHSTSEMIVTAPSSGFNHASVTSFACTSRPYSKKISKSTTTRDKPNLTNTSLSPIRSCLTTKEIWNQEAKEIVIHNKKRVCFADDFGLSLTNVKIMTEPSNCPPRWTDEFLERVTKGTMLHVESVNKWALTFAQPASDYIEFRNKLECNCVSLENVILKNDDDLMKGTVKVKNLDYDKLVFIRVSFNKWNSYKDVVCEYVPNGDSSAPYDTFSFSIHIPKSAANFRDFEFCICFRCNGKEYWDSYNGNNYQLKLCVDKVTSLPNGMLCTDAVKANLGTWTEFASWNHLVLDGPYW